MNRLLGGGNIGDFNFSVCKALVKIKAPTQETRTKQLKSRTVSDENVRRGFEGKALYFCGDGGVWSFSHSAAGCRL